MGTRLVRNEETLGSIPRPLIMTREEIQKLLNEDMSGWEIAEDELFFSSYKIFSLIIRNGNRERVVVIENGKIAVEE